MDQAEALVTGVVRIGYGVVGWPLQLLPEESRIHLNNAIRALSLGVIDVPKGLVDIAVREVERWADEDSGPVGRTTLKVEIIDESHIAPRLIAAPVKVEEPAPVKIVAEKPAAPVKIVTEEPAPVKIVVEEPVAPVVVEEPVAPVVVEEPVAPVVVEEPVAPVVVEEPVAPVVAEEPVAPVVAEEPVAPVVVEEPVAPVVAEEPVAPVVAEAPAQVSGVTITHIEYDPPGRDLDGEYVLIWNNSENPVKMNGWTLSDGDAKHTFTFRNYTLAPNAEIKVWSKRGKTGGGNFYWSNRIAIWNNDGDTGTLKDAEGNIISTYSYSGKKKKS
ncbi:hypothetical protein OSCT_1575 [Oscillochloris trichoides DG-6]|uniref:LTD domain-containing protein n=1 Tax=Oscillochloris trichoides DG-6 TaxID=765420 RepID=E1IE24_9CHLR|nr:hypothetical protein OSCT_1575 [Oscillochloris trichoides DG-6]